MSRKGQGGSLESLVTEQPILFGQNGQAPEEKPIEVLEVEEPGSEQPNPVNQCMTTAIDSDFLLACGEGEALSVERAKLDILESAGRMLDDYIRIGKRLFIIRERLPHGEFLEYMKNEFPLSIRAAQECMLIARRVMNSKCAHARAFVQVVSGDTKKKALLMLGVSDEELKEAEATGEFLGRPLEEIGQMSYRQLKEELRRRERDLERARRQRDKAESALSDLQEENQVLREGPAPGARELSPLERDFTQLILACARLLGTAQDAPEEELVRDGQGYLSRLMQEVNLLSRALYPFEIPAEPFGGADQEA